MGLWRDALEDLQEMKSNGLVAAATYNAMISVSCQQGDLQGALQLLEALKESGLTPSNETYTPLVKEMCKEQKWKQIDGVLEEMQQWNITGDAVFYTSLIDGLRKKRQWN